MSVLAPLYKQLFSVCSNGGTPNLKFVAALMNVRKTKPVYHHGQNLQVWGPDASGKIRMVGKHWRDLAQDRDKLEICFRKALGLQTAK